MENTKFNSYMTVISAYQGDYQDFEKYGKGTISLRANDSSENEQCLT